MLDILPIDEAWGILGRDSQQIIRFVMGRTSLNDRVDAMDEILVRARKIARKLSARYHPDVNQNNPEAELKFKAIQQAIKSIEHHTEQFKSKASRIESDKRLEQMRSSKVTIVINK